MGVLDSTRRVVEQATHARIDNDAIARWAASVEPSALNPAGHDLLARLPGDRDTLANLILLIDALNFCFWSSDPISTEWEGNTCRGYNAMFVSILRAAEQDSGWADPATWATVPRGTFEAVIRPRGELLLMEERVAILRATADILTEQFDGRFAKAVAAAEGRAGPLAQLVASRFESFRDMATYRGEPVQFLKRAQILALDLSAAWAAHGHEPLAGLDELTAFADYRIPQALRHIRIMRLTDELADRIDRQGVEIAAGSEEEIEIRAAAIHAVHRMAKALDDRGLKTAAWEIDWHLWDRSHDEAVRVDHHRTRTIYY